MSSDPWKTIGCLIYFGIFGIIAALYFLIVGVIWLIEHVSITF